VNARHAILAPTLLLLALAPFSHARNQDTAVTVTDIANDGFRIVMEKAMETRFLPRAGQAGAALLPPGASPRFELVQPDGVGVSGGQPNCWADFNNDGWLDLFVGMNGKSPNKLYLGSSAGTFENAASEAGVADAVDTRGLGCGDFDGDGNIDLYVAFTKRSGVANKLYRNDGSGQHFTDVAGAWGVNLSGMESRQVAFVDYDNDGRPDLFVSERDAPNNLFHNEGGRFRNVAKEMGVDDPRKTVGGVWFDYNQDGRLDLFVANQDGDRNGLWRNDGTRFTDVAGELGMDGVALGGAAAPPRPARLGSNGPSVVDFDNDGLLDLFVAGYGRNFLYRNGGNGRFADVAERTGVAGGDRATPSAWGDYDNDGRPDLYVSSYIDKPVNERDFFFHNEGATFTDATPELFRKRGATHGVQFADFDKDGAVDLALCNNNPEGRNSIARNVLPAAQARRSLQVIVLDSKGHFTRAGSEIRLYAAGSRKVVGSRIVDTGSGYTSQSAAPVHFGLGGVKSVDVEVTYFTKQGRRTVTKKNVNAAKLPHGILTVKVPN
jgi:penicillin G amidase